MSIDRPQARARKRRPESSNTKSPEHSPRALFLRASFCQAKGFRFDPFRPPKPKVVSSTLARDIFLLVSQELVPEIPPDFKPQSDVDFSALEEVAKPRRRRE